MPKSFTVKRTGAEFVVTVDDTDYDVIVAGGPWYINYRGYATSSMGQGRDKTFFMHRFLLGALPGQVVDHINNDKLDNRRENIRICTHRENARNRPINTTNSSGYKGVCWNKNARKWQANIRVGDTGTHLYLGLFLTREEAYEAYCKAATIHHGEFARLR